MTKPVPLIPKRRIKPDADITALINEDGYILNSVHAEKFLAIVKPADVIGKHLSDLYNPVPNEFIRALERAFEGESHWKTVTLPTITPLGIIDRRFVVAYLPWQPIEGKAVALLRGKLLSDDLNEALQHMKQGQRKHLRERANYLISGEFSLDDVYIDAITDVVMRQSGFDATILLDEDGLVLDIFSNTGEPSVVPEGGNFLEFMAMIDAGFAGRWQFMLDHSQYVNGIEEFPNLEGEPVRILSRARVTRLKSDTGRRIVQVFARKISR